MIPLPLAEVEPLGRLTRSGWTDRATGMQVDSRKIEEGDLFVAVAGGADFAKHALARGASAVLVPDDEFGALAAIGAAVRSRSDAKVVGITGSTGKTSTKDILAALCRPVARTVAAEGSFNNELGVPLTLCRIEPDTEICIVEMGMRGFGQIAELCAYAKPDAGVITAVGPAHLALVGSIEGVARSKAELLEALPKRGTAIVPDDTPELDRYLRDDLIVL
ncbi:MAG: Mur ligase family protein, partial [Gaiellaceae bacterium]